MIDLIDILKSLSIDTWERINFSWKTNGLKTYEVTITQNLIFSLMKLQPLINQSLRIFESTNEKANGNDIELYIKYNRGFLFHPVQAKLIYKTNNYNKIDHKVGGRQQIENLIQYAKTNNGIALYFFYNSSVNNNLQNHFGNIDYHYYGVSFSLAESIKQKFFIDKNWTIPKLEDVNPSMSWPLHYIIPNMSKVDYTSKIGFYRNLISNKENIKFMSFDEINMENWNEISSQEGIGRVQNSEISKNPVVKENEEDFNPKFRFVLDNESTGHSIYYVS